MGKLGRLANSVLKAADLAVCRRSDYEEFAQGRELAHGPSYRAGTLPPGAEVYLQAANPRLVDLRERYRELDHPAAAHTLWTDEYLGRELDLRYFRGDNAYVWQHRDYNNEHKHLVTACYLRELDTLDLLSRLEEDELFGVWGVRVSARQVLTRDLLDSVSEILFLERELGISRVVGLEVLDVGAGYGRLAHRLVRGLPNLARVHCVDAVAESTFLCEYYLRFRGVEERARAVSLDRLEDALRPGQVHLAVNMHSFAECSSAVVRWWATFLRERAVPRLLVVSLSDPTGERILSREPDGTRVDLLPTLADAGYRLALQVPKYPDPMVQARGVSPAFHYLLELEG